jgi:hypothetical protein
MSYFLQAFNNIANCTGSYTLSQTEIISWDCVETRPTQAALETEMARLEAEYESKLYQRERKYLYPPLSEFADAYYWEKKGDTSRMASWVEACALVKDNYPLG